ncbi:MAG: transporter [Proteobacteria bacterium]|nr:transporter [Pseudomonadota bacterium]
MNSKGSLKQIVLATLLAFGLVACDKPGPAETAGKNIDQAVETAGNKIGQSAENAGNKIGQSAENAGDKIGQTLEKAGQKMDRMANTAGDKIEATADKVGDKLGEQGKKADVVIGDTEITAKVKAAIFAEPGLRTLQISVDTVKGVVTLTGSVDSMVNKDRARVLAGAVAGVKDVDNRLVAGAS